MNTGHNHPGVAIGPLPIRMVAGHGAGSHVGHVGLGIGMSIMAGNPVQVPHMVHQSQLPNPSNCQGQSQNKLVSPDSSDDGIGINRRGQSPSSTGQPVPGQIQQHQQHQGTNTLPWATPILQPISGMGYPVMGMSVMGEPNILYGINLISASAPNTHNHNHNGPQELAVPHQHQHQHPQNQTGVVPTNSQIQNNNNSTCVSSVIGVPSSTALSQQQQSVLTKEIIHCKSCTLFPPNPSAPLPTTREKPPGCRTVFVGGLPENASDDIAREIFERCGEITTIRMSKKNFCHIRFELESFVENGIYLSGYRVRIGSNSDAANIGRLHVDYAQARDDLYEWECRQRQLLREQRHRERLEQERLLPPSPPPVVHFSEHEALNLSERLKVDESYMKGIQVLITWLDRGDCNKRNANTFYSMIQSTNSHVRRLLTEKSQYEEELQRANELTRQRMQGLLMQFGQIEKVFVASCHKKVWDHFTKAQRKNIETWKKQAVEIKNLQLEEVLNDRTDEEMDLSDSELSDGSESGNGNTGSRSKKIRLEDEKTVNQLKEENDALRCQLEAFKNEVDLIKADLKTDLEDKDRQIQTLQEQLIHTNRINAMPSSSPTQSDSETKRNTGDKFGSNLPSKYAYLRNNNNGERSGNGILEKCDSSTQQLILYEREADLQLLQITENEARLIGIISTFLNVHPFGASLDYIWSYTQKIIPTVRRNQIESLVVKLPSLFREELSGVGATFERKWVFVGFHQNVISF